jgi:hypothetical protein
VLQKSKAHLLTPDLVKAAQSVRDKAIKLKEMGKGLRENKMTKKERKTN